MASQKRPSWAVSIVATLRGVFAPLAGSGRNAFGIVLFVVLMIIAGYVGWAKWGGIVARGPRYILTAESFEITPQPSWIHCDVKAEVMRDGSLAELSVLDSDLTKRVAQAFELNTWVAETLWAAKRPGSNGPRVIVKLRYRQPVIMVRTQDKRWKGDCFWPVDTDGIFLPPEDFSASQTRNFLRVEAGNSLPVGAVGTSYGDPGVSGAARIAALLQGNWKPMGLEWIVVNDNRPQDVGQPMEQTFVLLPVGSSPETVTSRIGARTSPIDTAGRGTAQVRWGRAPGREAEGEAIASVKIARLQHLVRQNGPLDKLPPDTIIDLRPAPQIAVIRPDSQFHPASQR